MIASQFPSHREDRADVGAGCKESLSELMQSLRSMAITLGRAFDISELGELSQSIDKLQTQLLATSDQSVEGVLVRQQCQQLLESAACGLLEIARNNRDDESGPLLS